VRVRASGWATKLRPCSDDATRAPACVAPLLGGSQGGRGGLEGIYAGGCAAAAANAGRGRPRSIGHRSFIFDISSTGVVKVKNEI
jgi:hypothetical protein